jgi:glycosyltransferase involved in cell wall biosynthesis
VKRIAIVVQRCHESVVGGSEALAWQYARLLSEHFEVEVLTSTSTEHATWSNALPAAVVLREGILVRYFPVTITRQPYWGELYHRLAAVHDSGATHPTRWREALQDEFIRFQGPVCPDLDLWLRAHLMDYAVVLFCTYLYPTTYFGIRAVPPHKAILVPTLHDELAARLPVFAALYARYRQRIWLTAAEQRTAARIWNSESGEVLGMAVEHTESAQPEKRKRPYLLYCGRIEAGKGCDELLRAFERLPSRGRVSLVFTGIDNMGLPKSSDIEYLGFVDEQRKLALMAGAIAFVLPSQYESFSIVTLEAMAQRTPVLVNGRCEVMRDHIEHSGGGFHYSDPDDMIAKMERLCTLATDERAQMGTAGRDYVTANYGEERIRNRLIDYVERVVAASERSVA